MYISNVDKEEQSRLRYMSRHLKRRRDNPLRTTPKVSFVQAFWYAYPIMFFYAWTGIFW